MQGRFGDSEGLYEGVDAGQGGARENVNKKGNADPRKGLARGGPFRHGN